jgi:hypothetical protein
MKQSAMHFGRKQFHAATRARNEPLTTPIRDVLEDLSTHARIPEATQVTRDGLRRIAGVIRCIEECSDLICHRD